MEDASIITLYFDRNEAAISETDKKYGAYCTSIAFNILCSNEDAKECVNDTYLHTWNSIPPNQPSMLRTYLGKICRNISLDRLKRYMAKKRGGNEITLVFSELENCIASTDSVIDALQEELLSQQISNFLRKCSKENRLIFVRRYFYTNSIKQIAERYGISESKVKTSLFRTRNALRNYLQKEGVIL